MDTTSAKRRRRRAKPVLHRGVSVSGVVRSFKGNDARLILWRGMVLVLFYPNRNRGGEWQGFQEMIEANSSLGGEP